MLREPWEQVDTDNNREPEWPIWFPTDPWGDFEPSWYDCFSIVAETCALPCIFIFATLCIVAAIVATVIVWR